MTTVYVTHSGDARTRFDRGYHVDSRLPLAVRSWARHGLERVAAFFPANAGAGRVALRLYRFRDEAAVRTAFGSPETAAVMAHAALHRPQAHGLRCHHEPASF